MKRIFILSLMLISIFALIGCSQKQAEAYAVNTFDVTPADKIDECYKNNETVTIVKYYEMSDETWSTDDYTYQYRLELTGRLNNAAKDSTYIILSNTKEITFEQAWKASGLSSNMDDYFDKENAIIVAMK